MVVTGALKQTFANPIQKGAANGSFMNSNTARFGFRDVFFHLKSTLMLLLLRSFLSRSCIVL